MKALYLSTRAENLKRLCWLRGIMISFEGIAFVLANTRFQLPISGILIVLMSNIILISSTAIRLAINKKEVGDREFFLQLFLDLLIQTSLLFFSGGYTNPLVSIYLVTVSIGAALLPGQYSRCLTFSAVFFYTLLMKWYLPAGFESGPERSLLHQQLVSTHLLGMWITFVFSALLINYFVGLMASALRKQQEDITIVRERQLRDENILAVAIQAAGAAHELGTPLATMAIVLGDLEDEYWEDDYRKVPEDSLALLKSQVEECKRKLQQLVAESRYNGIERVDSRDFLYRVIEKWQLIRPESELRYNTSQWPGSVFIPCDLTLYQAITALLDNAEDASPGQVSLSVKQHNEHIAIHILDKGIGFPQTFNASRYGIESMVTPLIRPFSQKENGLGLGLLLSQASIERMGGQVHIFSQHTGGTLTEILLPIISTKESFIP